MHARVRARCPSRSRSAACRDGCWIANETSVRLPSADSPAGWKSSSANVRARPAAPASSPGRAAAAAARDHGERPAQRACSRPGPHRGNNSPVLTWRSLAICPVVAVLAGCGSAPQWTPPPAPRIDDPLGDRRADRPTRAYVPAAARARRSLRARHGPGPLPRPRRALRPPARGRDPGRDRPASAARERARPDRRRRCRAPLRTLDPTGVVEFDRAGLTLGDLFAVWGEPYGSDRMLSFRGEPQVYVAGRPSPATSPLTDRAQIVVELGGYIPPHHSFNFPRAGSVSRHVLPL